MTSAQLSSEPILRDTAPPDLGPEASFALFQVDHQRSTSRPEVRRGRHEGRRRSVGEHQDTRFTHLPRCWRHSSSAGKPQTRISSSDSVGSGPDARHGFRRYAAFTEMRHISEVLSSLSHSSALDADRCTHKALGLLRTMPRLCGIVLRAGRPIFLANYGNQATYSGRRGSDRQSYAAGMRHSSGCRLPDLPHKSYISGCLGMHRRTRHRNSVAPSTEFNVSCQEKTAAYGRQGSTICLTQT